MIELALVIQMLALFAQVMVLVLVIRQNRATEEALKRFYANAARQAAWDVFAEILSDSE